MSESDDLKRQIAEATASLGGKVKTLEKHWKEDLLSPTFQIEKRPLAAVGIALGAGIVVGHQLSAEKLEPFALAFLATLAGELGKKYFPDATPQITKIQEALLARAAPKA